VRPPSPKITRVKCTGGVVQAVEHLICKHKSLSLNPSPPPTPSKKRNNKTKLNRGKCKILHYSSKLQMQNEPYDFVSGHGFAKKANDIMNFIPRNAEFHSGK
jgi:hypothetical protein